MVSPSRSHKIAPSILAADFAHLADAVDHVAPEADLLHVDVMDGHFVPNISIGAPVVSCLRPVTDLYLDCHLMIENPGEFLDQFAKAGADSCTVHVELGDPRPLFDRMRAHGMRVGLVLNPDTPLDAVVPYLEEIDILLFMSVHPGFGGQAFITEVLDKLRAARAIVDERELPVELEIDGGINLETAPLAAAAGADILVAGSAVFHTPDSAAAARAIRAAAWGTWHARGTHAAMSFAAKVLTVSDGVAEGVREDRSGDALVAALTEAGATVVERMVIADGTDHVAHALRTMARGFAGLVVTTGGTGFGPRDLTPEGTRAVLEREAPGLGEAIRRVSDEGGRGFGMLSRAMAGTIGQCLIVNTPGSAGGATEALAAVLPVIPHALDLLVGGRPH